MQIVPQDICQLHDIVKKIWVWGLGVWGPGLTIWKFRECLACQDILWARGGAGQTDAVVWYFYVFIISVAMVYGDMPSAGGCVTRLRCYSGVKSSIQSWDQTKILLHWQLWIQIPVPCPWLQLNEQMKCFKTSTIKHNSGLNETQTNFIFDLYFKPIVSQPLLNLQNPGRNFTLECHPGPCLSWIWNKWQSGIMSAN